MINEKIQASINNQINKEIYSAYFYVAMSAYANCQGLAGIANWFDIQVKEELAHTQMFYNYMNQQGGKVVLTAIDTPDQDFSSVKDLFEKTVTHEIYVTKLINDMVALAREEKDFATDNFLQWFVAEQVEEVASPTEILQKLNLIGDQADALFTLDNQLQQRVFNPPAMLLK